MRNLKIAPKQNNIIHLQIYGDSDGQPFLIIRTFKAEKAGTSKNSHYLRARK